jgi:hypothetical protein
VISATVLSFALAMNVHAEFTVSFSSPGTPQTMEQAIGNGLNFWNASDRSIPLELLVRDQVRDFLAQKFTVAMMKAPLCQDDMSNLYDIIRDGCAKNLQIAQKKDR